MSEDWKASATIRLSIHGYEVNYTLRQYAEDDPPEDSKVGAVLLKRVENFIEVSKRANHPPIFGKNSAPKAEAPDIPVIKEHWCDEHNCEFQKWERDGRSWYSHKVNGTDEWCNESKKK